MKVLQGFSLIVFVISLGLCEQSYIQPFKLPRVRRTFRSLDAVQPIGANGLIPSYSTKFLQPHPGTFSLTATPEYPVQYRQRTPRWPSIVNYQQIPYLSSSNVVSSYRRFRSVPTTSNMEVRSEFEEDNIEQEQSNDQSGQLRFLGWLFGRPSYSRYPDYSSLEHAAGIYGSRYPSGGGIYPNSPSGFGYPYSPSSSMVVEDCVESLDPYTHEMIEHCQEVPMYH